MTPANHAHSTISGASLDAPIDVVSALMANALLAAALHRPRDRDGAIVSARPAKPAPAARALVMA